MELPIGPPSAVPGQTSEFVCQTELHGRGDIGWSPWWRREISANNPRLWPMLPIFPAIAPSLRFTIHSTMFRMSETNRYFCSGSGEKSIDPIDPRSDVLRATKRDSPCLVGPTPRFRTEGLSVGSGCGRARLQNTHPHTPEAFWHVLGRSRRQRCHPRSLLPPQPRIRRYSRRGMMPFPCRAPTLAALTLDRLILKEAAR
jgi:hypothetical protein